MRIMRNKRTVFSYDKVKFMKKMGEKIRKIRKSKDLTQKELSLLTGIDRTYIVYIEQGKQSMGLYTFYKLKKALKVSYMDLLI